MKFNRNVTKMLQRSKGKENGENKRKTEKTRENETYLTEIKIE